MNLPINLFFILQGKLELLEKHTFNPFSSQPIIQPEIVKSELQIKDEPKMEIGKQIEQIKEEPKNKIETNINDIKFEDPNKDQIQIDVNNLLEYLLTEIDDSTKAKTVLQMMHKLILNIVNNPNETKYRRLKLTNSNYKTYIEGYTGALSFLQYSRWEFTFNNEYLEFVGDVGYLIQILEKLDNFLIAKGFAELNFDPYKTSILSTSGTLDDIKKIIKPTDFDELLRQEKHRRNVIKF